MFVVCVFELKYNRHIYNLIYECARRFLVPVLGGSSFYCIPTHPTFDYILVQTALHHFAAGRRLLLMLLHLLLSERHARRRIVLLHLHRSTGRRSGRHRGRRRCCCRRRCRMIAQVRGGHGSGRSCGRIALLCLDGGRMHVLGDVVAFGSNGRRGGGSRCNGGNGRMLAVRVQSIGIGVVGGQRRGVGRRGRCGA